MLKYIKETYYAAKSGWYSGKGFKAHRKMQYEKALHFYQLARKFSDNDLNPVIYESMAFAHLKLNNHQKALLTAKKSLEQYNAICKNDSQFIEQIKRLEELINQLNNS